MLRPRSDFDLRYRRAWGEWPGMLPIAAVFTLWLAVTVGVLKPLAEAVVRLQSPVSAQMAPHHGLQNDRDVARQAPRAALSVGAQLPSGE